MRHERDVRVTAFRDQVMEGSEQGGGIGAVRVEEVLGVRQHGQGETRALRVEVSLATLAVAAIMVRARRRGAHRHRESADGRGGQCSLKQGTAPDTTLFAYGFHLSPTSLFIGNGWTVIRKRCHTKTPA
ncbi:hypothetical protein [Sphaerisporangium album]|uniref:hypothetical protein n=1 Tax=Sphaerisporangium album TaxID=509200 RepID=UPI001FE65950|nr:hypothetical protein [Sphaerisporangium album]